MSFHHQLRDYVEDQTGLVMRNYGYDDVSDKNVLGITFDIDPEDFEPIQELGTFELGVRKIWVRSSRELRSGKLEIMFNYEFTDNENYHQDITANGTKKYGVISPDGKFYGCHHEGHQYLEEELIQRKLIKPNPETNAKAFEWFGWVQLTFAYWTDVEWSFVFGVTKWDYETKKDILLKENKLTPEQYETMKAYILSLDRTSTIFNFGWYNIDDLKILTEINRETEYTILRELRDSEPDEPRTELEKENRKQELNPNEDVE